MIRSGDTVAQELDQGRMALWLAADCDDTTIRAALQLPWAMIWSAVDQKRLEALLGETRDTTYRFVSNKSDLPPLGTNTGGIIFVLDISIAPEIVGAEAVRRRRQAQSLENELEGWSGLLIYASQTRPPALWTELVEALSPTATLLLHDSDPGPSLNRPEEQTLLPRIVNLHQFFSDATDYIAERKRDDVLDLKDADGVPIPANELRALGDGWDLLTRRHTNALSDVSQHEFDSFLSGDTAWSALSAGVAYPRGAICTFVPDVAGAKKTCYDPVEYVCNTVKRLDKEERDPFDSAEQVLIYAERGAGCTTLLRQIALSIAREGYPTLITTPYPRDLSLDSLRNLVIALQNAWASARRGRGSGAGALPVCLVLDVDAELPARSAKLLRGLFTDLNRKLLVVRAVRRSDQEVSNARGVLQLHAGTTEDEILSIGRHLRTFSERRNLQTIPTDNEWRSFYDGFGRIRKTVGSADIDTPPLFLIGLYSFVKDRVRDEHSLERYLYSRWEEITDAGGRKLVEILAAAGAHGVAIPVESLMRDHALDNALFGRSGSNDTRLLDFFFRWLELGWRKQDWSLYIRHPAFGILLMRMLRTAEADAPYTPLLPVLTSLAGSEADRWFAEQLAYVIGQRLSRNSTAFTLEHDTAIQRAAREIFQAFPDHLHDHSRLICHHHARFYIHLLHACVDAIDDPRRTALTESVVERLAVDALEAATDLLERARTISDRKEKLSNVLNTLAASIAQLAQAYASKGKTAEAALYFEDAVERANEAVMHDAGNGHALFNLINTILHKFEKNFVNDPAEAADLFELSEDRLEALVRLHGNRQWRNVDVDDTDVTIATLIQRQVNVAKALGANMRVSFTVDSPAAQLVFTMRTILGLDTLPVAFRDQDRAARLRDLRDRLIGVERRSSRTALLLYKLYLNDPIGRLQFSKRLRLLGEVERQSPDDYDPYRHDHAALLCQDGSFEAGMTIFDQIHAARNADPDRWFWINERLLLDVDGQIVKPKQHVVRVTDAILGWARFENTSIRVKIQSRQFGTLIAGQYVKAFLRFRISGLQAIDERMARHDLIVMGLAKDNTN